MAALDWSEAYNCYSASAARGAFKLQCAYSSDRRLGTSGYRVSVNGIGLPNLYDTAEEGCAAAEKLAKDIALALLKQLGTGL